MKTIREKIKEKLETGLQLHHDTYHKGDTSDTSNLLNGIMEVVNTKPEKSYKIKCFTAEQWNKFTQALLSMESLKDEKISAGLRGIRFIVRNQLRKEMKAEINKLMGGCE